MTMTTKEMLKMRCDGATYQEISDACGLTRQAVHLRITEYTERITKGTRGKGFCLFDIKYKAIREHFADNSKLSISAFAKAVGVNASTMRNFLTGKNASYFTIPQIRRMCEIVGKPFEDVFGDGKESEKE
jgi:DNA-binding XRE family transcriptional regulator